MIFVTFKYGIMSRWEGAAGRKFAGIAFKLLSVQTESKGRLKDLIDDILYRLRPRPQFNVEDQVPSSLNIIFKCQGWRRQRRASEWYRIRSLTADHELYKLWVKTERHGLAFSIYLFIFFLSKTWALQPYQGFEGNAIMWLNTELWEAFKKKTLIYLLWGGKKSKRTPFRNGEGGVLNSPHIIYSMNIKDVWDLCSFVYFWKESAAFPGHLHAHLL